MSAGIVGVTNLLPYFTRNLGSAGAAVAAFSLKAAPWLIGLSAVAVAIYALKKAYDEARPSLEETNEKIATNEERLRQLESIPWANRTAEMQDEIDHLKELNKELNEYREQLRDTTTEERQAGFQEQFGTNLKQYAVGATGETVWASSLEEAVDLANKRLKELGYTANEAGQYIYSNIEGAFQDTADILEVLDEKYINANKNIEDMISEYEILAQKLDSGVDLTAEESVRFYELQTAIGGANSYLNESIEATGKLSTEDRKLLDETGKLVPHFDDYNKVLYNAQSLLARLADGTGLTASEMASLTAKFPSLKEGLSETDGLFYANTQSIVGLIAAQVDFNNTNLDVSQKLSALQVLAQAAGETAAMIAAILSPEAMQNFIDSEVRSGSTESAALQKYFTKFGEKYKEMYADAVTGDVVVGGDGNGGGTGTKTDPIEEQSKLFAEQNALLEDRLYFLQKSGATQEEQIEQLKAMQDAVHEQAEWYRSQNISEDSAYLRESGKLWHKYADQIAEIQKAILQTQKDNYDKAFAYLKTRIQEEIQLLEDEKTAIEDTYAERIANLNAENEAIEKQISLQEALQALAEAKTKKQLVFKDGQFQYVTDAEAVSNAQTNLESLQRQQKLEDETSALERERDAQIDSIDLLIKGWDDYGKAFDKMVGDVTSEQDRLIAEMIFGTKLEGDEWYKRLTNLQDYVDKYKALMAELEERPESGSTVTPNKIYGGGDSVSGEESALSAAGKKYNDALARGDKAGMQSAHAEAEAIRSKYGYSGGVAGDKYIPLYGNGTTSASGGLSLVGEKGPELRVLGKGDGVIPDDITKNLWSWGSMNPATMLSSFTGGYNKDGGGTMQFDIANISLPGVTNASQFVEELKGFRRYAFQYGTGA